PVGDADVAQEREAEPTADGVAVQRRDGRHRDLEYRQQRGVQREGQFVRQGVVGGRGRYRREVGPGAKARAAAGDDHDAQLPIRADPANAFRKARQQVRRYGVVILWLVQGDGGGRAATLVENRIAHVGPPITIAVVVWSPALPSLAVSVGGFVLHGFIRQP